MAPGALNIIFIGINVGHRFREHEAAVEFYETYNGAPFSSLEPERLCRIVWVSRVEWAHDGVPPPGHTELPTCPVCLGKVISKMYVFWLMFLVFR